MKKSRNHLKLLLASILCLSLLTTSISTAGQKVIGAYSTDSPATAVNSTGQSPSNIAQARPGILAVAQQLVATGAPAGVAAVGALAVSAVFLAGFTDGWNAVAAIADEPRVVTSNYNAGDFSKFDN